MRSSSPKRLPLSAAAAVFAERGYTGASVDQLSAAMTLDPATFRPRFKTKEGCFLRVYDRILAVAREHLAASLRAEQPWPARLAAALHCLLELVDANPAAARLVRVESQLHRRSRL